MSRYFNLSTIFLGVVVVLASHNNVSAISVEKYLTLTLSQKTALDKVFGLEDRYLSLFVRKFSSSFLFLSVTSSANFDINSAEAMFRENLKWREENGIDNMRNEDWSDLSSDYHVTIDTYDKTGRPIGTIDIYDWDVRRAVLQGKGQRLLRYVVNLVENITGQVYERQEKLGMNVTQSYYPEALDELIILDAPPTIQVILEAIRPFLTRTTRDAIRIFGPNRTKWIEYLDTKISKEERRQHYGGTKPPDKY
ncbi:SEC14-like protein 2 [Orchesella cincta]|uniref:SEC14-like protein 2 n=1 Tax=Orchesella cincta TaxID=48709 RepID=A0A1D2MAX3_ORCCI|nr:SEC14-like protein 2 [Orchesella cincta]